MAEAGEMTLAAPLAGWVVPLAEVPDAVFAAGMMGDGIAIDPVGDTLFAPCAAQVLTIHAAGHALTLRADNGAELLIHIGMDTVALGGAGFTALVRAGDRVAAGDALIRFDLDALVRDVPAVVTPLIVTDSDRFAIRHRAGAGMIAVGAPLLVLVARDAVAAAAAAVVTGARARRAMTVGLPHGLHARPAARIVAAVRALDAAAWLVRDDRRAACTSTVAMLGLGLGHDAAVTIEAEGRDAHAAIDAVAALLTTEVDAAPPPRAVAAAPPATLPAGALPGVPAAPGLAIGRAHWLRGAGPVIPAGSAGAPRELSRLAAGLAEVDAALDAAARAPGAVGTVLAAHRAILDDPDLHAAATTAIDAGANAAAAWMQGIEAQARQLRGAGDARIAERADDLIDIGHRVAHAILGTTPGAVVLAAGTILLADDLLPSQLVALDAARLAGIAVVRGGPTSHVAILAAGMGVPMLVAVGAAMQGVADGATVLLDADAGMLVADPDAVLTAGARTTIAARVAAEAAARARGDAPARTADGVTIGVHANLGSAADARAAAEAGAEGCGLLRTEFLFLDRATPPDAAEQCSDYQAVADALPDRPIIIRLLDVGGDKPAPYLSFAAEENPALGLRGVRVSLDRPDLLAAQLRAILSMRDAARCKIMVPMVASVGELVAVRAVLDALCAEMGAAPVPLGAMVETPAAAIGADLIARHADFLSIGSNDLTQYVLAMDRGNPAVAAGIDGLHPAVLRLIAATCEGGAAAGVPVSVCGGLAADPLAAPILVGLGVRTLSVPPARIVATKALVAALTLPRAADHARAALACESAAAVRALARTFAQEIAA